MLGVPGKPRNHKRSYDPKSAISFSLGDEVQEEGPVQYKLFGKAAEEDTRRKYESKVVACWVIYTIGLYE